MNVFHINLEAQTASEVEAVFYLKHWQNPGLEAKISKCPREFLEPISKCCNTDRFNLYRENSKQTDKTLLPVFLSLPPEDWEMFLWEMSSMTQNFFN